MSVSKTAVVVTKMALTSLQAPAKTCFILINIHLILNENQRRKTRKLATGCSKHCFEVVDKTDEVSNHIYGKATLTRFEEIFEEYKIFPQ